MLPLKDQPEQQKSKEKTMFLGFGNYGVLPLPYIDGGYIRNSSFFDKLFELFGVKEKPPKAEDNPKD